jgi:solute carrier family 25 phosphate transporter 23/24/25/41
MILFWVVLQIPYEGLNFALYETLKDWMMKSPTFRPDDGAELGVVTKLACGAAAGTVGQTVTYPLDVVRRRMQMVGWKDASSIVTADGQVRAPVQYNGMVDAFRKTVKTEGPRALYKGLVPNSVKVRNKLSNLFNVYGGMHMVDAFRKIVKNKR